MPRQVRVLFVWEPRAEARKRCLLGWERRRSILPREAKFTVWYGLVDVRKERSARTCEYGQFAGWRRDGIKRRKAPFFRRRFRLSTYDLNAQALPAELLNGYGHRQIHSAGHGR